MFWTSIISIALAVILLKLGVYTLFFMLLAFKVAVVLVIVAFICHRRRVR